MKVDKIKNEFKDLMTGIKTLGDKLSLQGKTINHPLFSKSTLPAGHQQITAMFCGIRDQAQLIEKCIEDLSGETEEEKTNKPLKIRKKDKVKSSSGDNITHEGGEQL